MTMTMTMKIPHSSPCCSYRTQRVREASQELSPPGQILGSSRAQRIVEHRRGKLRQSLKLLATHFGALLLLSRGFLYQSYQILFDHPVCSFRKEKKSLSSKHSSISITNPCLWTLISLISSNLLNVMIPLCKLLVPSSDSPPIHMNRLLKN